MAGDEKKADVWMPLWIGAYLADTMKLTTIQHGAYFLLLIAYWRERGPLKDDDDELRSVTKLERAEWKRIRPVLSTFFKVGNGVWWHKRVEAEIAAADKRSKAAAEKASKAAEARWGKGDKQPASNPPINAPSMPEALPEEMRDECPPPSPLPPSEDIDPDGSHPSPSEPLACPVEEIIALYHDAMPDNPRVKVATQARRAAIKSRWREASRLTCKPFGYRTRDDGLAAWRAFFETCGESAFLTGKADPRPGKPPFIADIEFLMSPSGFAKCLENKYHRETA